MDAVGSILAGIIFWSLIGYFVYRRFKPSHGRNRSSWVRRPRGGQPVTIGPLPYQKK